MKLEAKDLRLGNYVNDNLGGILKIKGLSEKSTFNHIKPIELTEEWLIKFGFISNPYDDVYELGSFHVNCDKTTGVLRLWCEINNKIVDLKTVHHLQNLYFAITGEELEINNI